MRVLNSKVISNQWASNQFGKGPPPPGGGCFFPGLLTYLITGYWLLVTSSFAD